MTRPLPAAVLAALLPALGPAAAPAPPLASPPVFEVLPSTRRVTRLLPLGDRLLVATTGGLVVLGPEGRRLLLPGVPIRTLVPEPGRPGAALAGTDAGPARILPERAEMLGTAPEPTPLVTVVEHQGERFAGSLDGLRRLPAGGAPEPEVLDADPLATHVTALAALSGRLWAGTPVGLFMKEGGRWQAVPWEPKHPSHVTALATGPDGALLVGTAGDGTWKLEKARLQRLAGEPAVVTALASWQGEVWAGTDGGGAVALGRPGRAASVGPDEPPSNAITSLAWARDWRTLAVGTFDRGLGLRQDGTWRRAGLGAGLPSDWINQVASDGDRVLVRLSDGNVMASQGSDGWLAMGRPQGWPKAWTGSLGSDRGRLWVGTQNAFYLSLRSAWEVFAPKPELAGVEVLDVALRDTEAWIATHRHGLLRWDRWRQRFDRLTHGAGLPDPWVTTVEVFRGRVFAGTFDGGLVEVEDGGPGTPAGALRALEGLPSPAVEALLATDEALFIGTLDGLGLTRDGRTVTRLGPAHGLPSPHVTSLASDGTHLWVGTPSGLARAPLAQLLGGAP